MNKSLLVFDMDGTLVDTQEAVRQAYLRAGVRISDDAWGKPWQEWLIGPNAKYHHDLKNKYYGEMLRKYAKPLPLLEFAIRVKAPVITAASHEAASLVEQLFGLTIALENANIERKCEYLLRQPHCGTYVDDHEQTRKIIREKTKWFAISPEEALDEFNL